MCPGKNITSVDDLNVYRPMPTSGELVTRSTSSM
jgi:hypothetical protein